MISKNTICLWYDGTALDAARFYAETFPDSAVGAIHRSPGDYPSGKEGDVLTVEFTVIGIPCLGLNGGPAFKHSEAFSFQVATDDQAETDRLWNAIVSNGGAESQCGWCKDKWGLNWQITPRALTDAITDRDPAAAKRAFNAMVLARFRFGEVQVVQARCGVAMHAGQFASLEQVVQHYAQSPKAAIGHSELARPGEKHAERQTIQLSAQDIRDVAAFLGTLTGPVIQPR